MENTRLHWQSFAPVTDRGDNIYHLAGADKPIAGSGKMLDCRILIRYMYRFSFEKFLLRGILERFFKARDMQSLDVGCGTGRNAITLSEYCSSVDAFDISEAFIRENRKRFININNVHFFELDVSAIVEIKHKYDIIFLGGILMYLSDQEAARLLGHLKIILAPGGAVVARDTISKGETEYIDHTKVYRSQHDYEQLFTSAGLTLRRMYNGPGRNICLSIYNNLPSFVQKLLFNWFAYGARLLAKLDIALSLRRRFVRNSFANQLFYVYGHNL